MPGLAQKISLLSVSTTESDFHFLGSLPSHELPFVLAGNDDIFVFESQRWGRLLVRDISTVDGEAPYFHHSATLRVAGHIEDFESITHALGVNPTDQHRAGEKKGPGSPAYREDLWSYSPSIDERQPLDKHIQALWKVLEPHREKILALRKSLKVDIFCGYRTNHWGAGFEVTPKSLRMFVELDIPFGVSVIVS